MIDDVLAPPGVITKERAEGLLRLHKQGALDLDWAELQLVSLVARGEPCLNSQREAIYRLTLKGWMEP